ncbi:pentapeptide repeat-containing protein [Gimesia chilikensis]|uniref:pentapeptide repeat-containing protein n=1 Tax=Gimesia chilikensis TaxID=2605989 RepID=UPI003A94D3DB
MIQSTPTQHEFNKLLNQHQYRMQDSENYDLKDRLTFIGVNLAALDLSDTDLKGVFFYRCVFSNDLSGADFSDSVLENCFFNDAIMSHCKFRNVILTDSSFRNCQMDNVDMQRVRGEGRIGFRECDLTGSVLSYGRWNRSRFDHCNLTDVKMHSSDMKKVIIEDCEVAGLCLCACDLEKTELYNTNLLVIGTDGTRFSNIIITAKTLCIGDRCRTHEEWFAETIEEVESYQHDGYPNFLFKDWGRWAPALKLMCEQVRIGLFKPDTEVKEHACVES